MCIFLIPWSIWCMQEYRFLQSYLEHPSTCVYRPRLFGDIAGLGLKSHSTYVNFKNLALIEIALIVEIASIEINWGYIINCGYIGPDIAAIDEIASIVTFWTIEAKLWFFHTSCTCITIFQIYKNVKNTCAM